MSILLAEHEPEVAEMSARYLRKDGLRVRLVTTPELALAELAGGSDAAAVLDLTMPGLDPRRIRRALRAPVIFLTAGPRPRGLARDAAGTGPRRWLHRPFSPRQLVTLVRGVLAAPAGPEPTPAGHAGRAGRLTPTELAVLTALAEQAGRAVSRRQLLAAAGRDRAGDRAADLYVAQIRAKLGSAVAIRTVRGTGYVMDGPPV